MLLCREPLDALSSPEQPGSGVCIWNLSKHSVCRWSISTQLCTKRWFHRMSSAWYVVCA